jgi:hypothetical protein
MVDILVGTHLAPTMVYNPFIMHLAQNVHRTFAMADILIGMHLALVRVDILGKIQLAPNMVYTPFETHMALAIVNILVRMFLTHHVHVKTLAMVSALVKYT